MNIKKIEWLDEGNKEAILEIFNNNKTLICFSHPCHYNLNDELKEPLQCLDAYDIILCEEEQTKAERINETFEYKLTGKVTNVEDGIIEIDGFILRIDKNTIPKDIVNGDYIKFVTSRIDVW